MVLRFKEIACLVTVASGMALVGMQVTKQAAAATEKTGCATDVSCSVNAMTLNQYVSSLASFDRVKQADLTVEVAWAWMAGTGANCLTCHPDGFVTDAMLPGHGPKAIQFP
ncbi:hypothetical protein [Ensifer sp. YR511]|uniref:hypothetical protein n=1 Tax=Ensifer sp. YR511 TaxID=1855294 RepID=UPI000885EDF3|nr:hypothetical protein [Ensifer sp. YR511]SDN72104.1 hypothetical protein SAMN05216328_13453 [Ensifer sp. YR511]